MGDTPGVFNDAIPVYRLIGIFFHTMLTKLNFAIAKYVITVKYFAAVAGTWRPMYPYSFPLVSISKRVRETCFHLIVFN